MFFKGVINTIVLMDVYYSSHEWLFLFKYIYAYIKRFS